MGASSEPMDVATRSDLARLVAGRVARDVDDFAPVLSQLLTGLLAGYAQRDRGLVAERLLALKSRLGGLVDGTVDLVFGGSLAKQTYVEGLSDVDCLLFVDPVWVKAPPAAVLDRLAAALTDMPVEIRTGAMAVTVAYADGSEIQLLPAGRSRGSRTLLPEPGSDGWADVGPADFAETLRMLDRRCGYKLIPAVKLAKAAMATLPVDVRLSGYHLESLAVATFGGYEGPMTTSDILFELIRSASERVLSPIRDYTGQSIGADAGLGPVRSRVRRRVARELGLLHRSMIAASRARSVSAWRALLDVAR